MRTGIMDSEAAKRRVGYRWKEKHAADMEVDADACNKALSLKYGLTQGVCNVLYPHVIALGYRCLFRADRVGEALSDVLERFPVLPRGIFYDVACKLGKNALRRVRPILRSHKVRCIPGRPHSITHSCSPVYMPGESLGTTAGVATQAAEVSHSIAVGNQTSLANMAPEIYMVHKMVQVAFMNIRNLHRLSLDNLTAESDHVPLAPFYLGGLVRNCLRGSNCTCQTNGLDTNPPVLDDPVSNPTPTDDEGTRSRVSFTDTHEDLHLPGPMRSGDEVTGADCDDALIPRASRNRTEPVMNVVHEGSGDAVVADANRHVASTGVCLSPMATTPLTDAEADLVASSTADLRYFAELRGLNRANTVLKVADLRVLQGGSWLNDAVLNSFASLVNHRDRVARSVFAARPRSILEAADDSQSVALPRTYIFGTYFYARLSERAGAYDYDGVKSSAKKGHLRLDDVDLILATIHVKRSHWVLASINVRLRHFLFYDSFFGEDHECIISMLLRWLNDEVVQSLGPTVADSWGVASWALSVVCGMPRQTDSGSCGIFELAAADCLSKGAPVSF